LSIANSQTDVIGLIPAGGHATRISPLPCSKEIYPVGFRSTEDGRGSRPKVVAHYLLEKMQCAGIARAFIVLRPGKWDIPAYFGDGSMLGMHLAYLILGAPYGVPFTLDQAHPFAQNATVAFGFPDILFDSPNPFGALLERQSRSGADVILGLCRATHPLSKEDRVELNDKGEVRNIILRPAESSLDRSWAIAVWKPSFTDFLHRYVKSQTNPESQPELSAGHAIQAGLQAGLRVEGVIISESPYVDVGTPAGLSKVLELEITNFRKELEGNVGNPEILKGD
jgi:glucose-1-phosphate thymidylyltransferase